MNLGPGVSTINVYWELGKLGVFQEVWVAVVKKFPLRWNWDNKSIQRGKLAHFAILWWKITLFVAFSVWRGDRKANIYQISLLQVGDKYSTYSHFIHLRFQGELKLLSVSQTGHPVKKSPSQDVTMEKGVKTSPNQVIWSNILVKLSPGMGKSIGHNLRWWFWCW